MELIKIELNWSSLTGSVELATELGLLKMTMDDISEEIKASRTNAK